MIADTAEVVRNDRPDTTGNLDIEKVGARYGGLSEDEIRELGDNLILGDATVVATKDDADDPDNISYRGSDPQMVRAKKGDDIVQTGSGDDEIDGGFGNDTLKGGDGRDAIEGGPENDIIDGGSNGSREGDEAIFAGKFVRLYDYSKTDDGSGTVTGLAQSGLLYGNRQ